MKYLSTINMSRDEWLNVRRAGIGGSDAGAILGINPYKSPLAVYIDKTEGDNQPETARQRAGRLIEDAIAHAWAEETGWDIRKDNKIRFHEEFPFLLANLDRVITGDQRGAGVLECKNINSFRLKAANDDGFEAIPEHLAQVHHYLAVTGFTWGEIAYWVDGWDLRRVLVNRDDDWLDRVYYPVVCGFWNTHIVPMVPPEPRDEDEARRTFDKVAPGKTVEATDEEMAASVRRLKDIRASMKLFEEEEAAIKTAIMNRIADGEALTWKGSVLATWKRTKDSEKFDASAFEKENPDLYRRYFRVVPGYRRLVVK